MDGPDNEEAEAEAIGALMNPRTADSAEVEAAATMMANRDQTDLLADMGEQVRPELPALPVPPAVVRRLPVVTRIQPPKIAAGPQQKDVQLRRGPGAPRYAPRPGTEGRTPEVLMLAKKRRSTKPRRRKPRVSEKQWRTLDRALAAGRSYRQAAKATRVGVATAHRQAGTDTGVASQVLSTSPASEAPDPVRTRPFPSVRRNPGRFVLISRGLWTFTDA